MADKLYAGIDPGKSGAMAFLQGDHVDFIDFKSPSTTSRQVRERILIDAPCVVGLERVHAFPGQGVVSSFNFGVNFGFWQGLLTALDLDYQLVTPQRWQGGVGLPPKTKAYPKPSLPTARMLFPKLAYALRLKSHHDRSDALMLAVYMRSEFEGPHTVAYNNDMTTQGALHARKLREGGTPKKGP